MPRPLALLFPLAAFALLFGVTVMQTAPDSPMASVSLAPRESENQRMQRMLDSARLHMVIASADPFVGEVRNVSKLRTLFAFYDAAKDGDILIMTDTQAILYDPVRDRITHAVSRREAYGELVPPGIRQLSLSIPAPTGQCACSAQSSRAPWILQPVKTPPAKGGN